MTRIVYASPHYVPPSGVIVLPLEAHPAILEDATFAKIPRKLPPRQGPSKLTILERQVLTWMQKHRSGISIQMAADLNRSPTTICAVLDRHPELFERLGKCEGKTNKCVVWGLVEDGDCNVDLL